MSKKKRLITLTVDGVTYQSDTMPENTRAACDAVFCGYCRREIQSLELLHAWNDLLPRVCALLGTGNHEVIARWAMRQFQITTDRKDLPRLNVLLAGGLQRLARGRRGATPLKVMVEQGWTEGVRALLAVKSTSGIDVNAADYASKVTALHHVAMRGKARVLDLLLEHGADPNVRDTADQTPLHYAVFAADSVAKVRALVKFGADLHAVSTVGMTPLDAARGNRNRKIAAYLGHLARRRAPAARPGTSAPFRPTILL